MSTAVNLVLTELAHLVDSSKLGSGLEILQLRDKTTDILYKGLTYPPGNWVKVRKKCASSKNMFGLTNYHKTCHYI